MGTFMRILIFIEEGRNQLVAIYFPPGFLHWYFSYLEKSRTESLRKVFTESGVVGILIFKLSVGHLYISLSWVQ